MSQINDKEEIREDVTKKRGIYLLPNILTTAGLFAGFYAVVSAMKGNFESSAEALFIAMIMDGLDGRAARLTGTESAFGAQYDSMSDMICFGMAPALIMYSWSLSYLGKIGWLAAFCYVASTGLRLSRFNSQEVADKRFFIGLPCPAAAAAVVSTMWLVTDCEGVGREFVGLSMLVTLLAASLMVSNIPFHSFKEVDFSGRVKFSAVLAVVLILALCAWDPPKVLFSVFFIYMFSGVLGLLWGYCKKSRNKKNA